jgi:FeS assembly SUF system protein
MKKKVSKVSVELLKENIIESLMGVYDPELPVNIYDLGLIYDIQIDNKHNVTVIMTLTTPACPMADLLLFQVEEAVSMVKNTEKVKVELTFDPPWTPEKMSDIAKLECGLL